MTLRRTLIALVSSACALLGPVGLAQANGRFPNAQQVLIGPGTSSRMIVLRVTFGLLVSRDSGRTFQWHCEELMFEPFAPSMISDPPVEITRFGTVVYGFNHGVNALTDGCSATGQASVAEREIVDLAATPDGSTLFAIDGTPGQPGRILRAPATTLSFAATGPALDGIRLTTIDVAPTDPMRLYLSGTDRLNNPLLLRSDDGGARVRVLAPAADLGDETFIAAVDPTDAQVVYVRTTRALGSTLLRSADGGERFETVARTADQMLGFALSGDGRTVWYGSGAAGLFRSDDRGRTFVPVSALPVFCLKEHQGTLWACTDWVRAGYALGRSSDGGRSFESALRWSEVPGPPACPGGTYGARLCGERWEGFQMELLFPDEKVDGGVPDASARDAGPSEMDGGASRTPSPDACACDLARHGDARPRGGSGVAALLLVAGVRSLRARRSRAIFTRRPT